MSPAGGLVGPPGARGVAPADAVPPGLAPQPPQQDGFHDGAEWGTFTNPCLRLFLADRSTPPQRLRALLAAAWKHDAKITLKLIGHIRDRYENTTGRGERESFYTAALWMHEEHPGTLCYNLAAFAELGYIKDMPELLYRLVKGPNIRELETAKAEAWKSAKEAEAEAKEAAVAAAAATLTRSAGRKRSRTDGDDPAPRSSSPLRRPSQPLVVADVAVRTKPSIKPDAVVPVDEVDESQADDEQKAAVTRSVSKRASKVAMDAAQALAMYNTDESYRRLYDCIADFFSERLKSDIEKLEANQNNKIGLAAKWCPSPDSAFDRATLLCEGIARRLFPWDTDDQKEDRWMAYKALGRLRRDVLVKLHKALQLPELYISKDTKNKWSEVPYERVAQLAMARYRRLFLKHDEERFTVFMEKRGRKMAKKSDYRPIDVTEERVTEDAYNILPHTVISKQTIYYRLAWHALVKDLKMKGLFRNCVAVLDLSNSMKGMMRHICLSIGLLLAELGFDHTATLPWKNSVRPFGLNPRPKLITKTIEDGRITDLENLKNRIADLDKLQPQCGDKIDLRFVFNSILNAAHQFSLAPEAMVRTVLVITNKDFDQAIARPWRKDYKAVCEQFTKAGFGSVVPQVVFWNLKGEHSAALTQTEDGVMRVTGFSNSFFKLFLKNSGIVTPENEMDAAIEPDAYNGLVVID